MITEFNVRNFKSVESASLDFKKVSFLVGKNGTGKSNLIDALSFISEASTSPLQTIFNKRGGTESVFRKVSSQFDARSIRTSLFERPNIEMSISIVFPHHYRSHGEDQPVSARYALALDAGIFRRSALERSARVRREQVIVTHESGKKRWFDRKGDNVNSNDEFFSRLPEGFIGLDSLALPLLAGFPNFSRLAFALKSMQSYSIDPVTLRDFQEADAAERLLPDGRNAVSILDQLRVSDKESLHRLLELLSSVAPGTLNVTTMSAGRKRFLRFSQTWAGGKRFRFEAFNMSEGTLRAFGLLLAIFQSNAPDCIIVEQPEDSLHPGATSVILEALRTLPRSQQAIITTHSPEVLDLLVPGSDAIYVADIHDGNTKVTAVAPHLIQGVSQHLCAGGDLLRLRLTDQSPLHDRVNISPIFEEIA